MASHLENIFDCDLFRLISFSCLYSSQCVHLYKLDANSHPLQTMPTHHSLIDSPSPRLVPMTKKSKKFEKEKIICMVCYKVTLNTSFFITGYSLPRNYIVN